MGRFLDSIFKMEAEREKREQEAALAKAFGELRLLKRQFDDATSRIAKLERLERERREEEQRGAMLFAEGAATGRFKIPSKGDDNPPPDHDSPDDLSRFLSAVKSMRFKPDGGSDA